MRERLSVSVSVSVSASVFVHICLRFLPSTASFSSAVATEMMVSVINTGKRQTMKMKTSVNEALVTFRWHLGDGTTVIGEKPI